MKLRFLLAAMFLIFALSACSVPHTMTLKDGRVIDAVDEPVFNKNTGFYEYETLNGKKVKVNKDEVIEIKEM